MDTNIYNDKFHENRELITGKAAEKVLKIIHEIVNVNSIVDVGCGIGVWLLKPPTFALLLTVLPVHK